MATSKTHFHGIPPNENLHAVVPDLVFLNVEDVVSIGGQYHIIHHKYYNTGNETMIYMVGPGSASHPRAGEISVGWSEEIQPS